MRGCFFFLWRKFFGSLNMEFMCFLINKLAKRNMSMLNDEILCLQNSSRQSQCLSCSNEQFCQSIDKYSFQSLLCSLGYIPMVIIVCIFACSCFLNVLCIGTFLQRNSREMGSGFYRLTISIIGQMNLTIIFCYFIFQRTNHGRLITCYLFESLEKCLHNLYDSLTACLTIERTFVIYQGLTFNKVVSQHKAKLIIPILISFQFLSVFYELFYRELNQSFCVLKSSNLVLRHYQIITNVFYFLIPYFINLILPFVWIITLTKNKILLHQTNRFYENFRNVIFNYQHTFIPNLILVTLNTPRFVSLFSYSCIQLKSYSIAYFISLIPLTSNLFIFVLPSPKYRPELVNFLHFRYRSL